MTCGVCQKEFKITDDGGMASSYDGVTWETWCSIACWEASKVDPVEGARYYVPCDFCDETGEDPTGNRCGYCLGIGRITKCPECEENPIASGMYRGDGEEVCEDCWNRIADEADSEKRQDPR